MPIYNLTGLETATTIGDLIIFANTSTQQLLVQGFLIGIFFVIFINLMIKHTFNESLVTSSFVCFVISLFLRQIEAIPFMYVIIFGVMTAFSGMYIYMTKE